MRIAFWTWAKDWLNLEDLLRVQQISIVGSTEKSRFKKLVYLWECTKLLTSKRTFFSMLYYSRIVASFDFKVEVDELPTIEQSEEKLIALCADIGSRCNKLPREVMRGMSNKEVKVFMKNLLLRHLEQSLQLISAHHAPDSYAKSVTSKMREITHELRHAPTKAIADVPRPFEPVRIREMFPI